MRAWHFGGFVILFLIFLLGWWWRGYHGNKLI